MPDNRELIEYLEDQMQKSSQSYFETTTNLIKWNTALAVAAILWFGNFIVNTTKPWNFVLTITAILSLFCLVIAIGISIAIFFLVSRYFNQYWVLCSQWRESIVGEYRPELGVITRLTEYYQNLPKTAKSFDYYMLLQIFLLAAGLGFFCGFILAFKLATP
jgi:hypothetical protein